jgi:SAM-dependent methyltransferase
MIIAHWLPSVAQCAVICEVGAGKSIVAEQLTRRGQRLDQLLITDQSARMLQYSHQFGGAGATLKVADAEKLPLAAGNVDCLVASLGDPYNNSEFWAEAFRVLSMRGNIIFTVPAYDWAEFFRKGARNTDSTKAEFELVDGRHVFLPSFIYPEAAQRANIESSGLKVLDVRYVTLNDLRGEKLSPKLGLDRGPEGAVVTGYFIQKVHRESENNAT